MIDVEQCSLSPLEQHAFAVFQGIQQIGGRVGHVRLQPGGIAVVLFVDLGRVQRRVIRLVGQHADQPVFLGDDRLQPPAELAAVQSPNAPRRSGRLYRGNRDQSLASSCRWLRRRFDFPISRSSSKCQGK